MPIGTGRFICSGPGSGGANPFFTPLIYSGNNTNDRNITGVGFVSDMLIIRGRNTGAGAYLFDSVRGIGNYIQLNGSAAQQSTTDLVSIDSDGFTIDTGSLGINSSGVNYINYDYRLTSTYGFDIVTWTGTGTSSRTLSHGIASTPGMIWAMGYAGSAGPFTYYAYHQGLSSPETKYIQLNSGASGSVTSSTAWNNTAPTSSTFTVGSALNGLGISYIAYVFSPVSGGVSIGSYIGNGSASGPTINTGFQPGFVILRGASIATDWNCFDVARNPSGNFGKYFPLNSAASEVDITGGVIAPNPTNFQIIDNATAWNQSGQTYVYYATAG